MAPCCGQCGSSGKPCGPDEDPAPEDVDRFSDVTQNCPHCGTELYDDAELCWKCGLAVADKPKAGVSVYVVAVIVIMIVATVAWGLF
jgi:hypothetical protein